MVVSIRIEDRGTGLYIVYKYRCTTGARGTLVRQDVGLHDLDRVLKELQAFAEGLCESA